MSNTDKPLVGVLMGSKSDWSTMQHTRDTLAEFGIAAECRVLSAHRTPKEAAEFVETAEERGIEVLIAAAGGAAHLAGVVAAHTVLPVLGVPMQAWSLDGLDSLLYSGGHSGHRQGRRGERGPAGRQHSRRHPA